MTAARSFSASLQQLNRIVLTSETASIPDAELVRRFVERRDEIAFTAIVQRYGLLVFGVCRRVLRHEQDAEDAFQATFLIFARDAASVQRASAIGNWLYGVAHNVARKAKIARYRRSIKETEAAQNTDTTFSVVIDDLPLLLDAELGALPDKYRAAIVLCDLMGLTTQQAADAVGCPSKTLGTRLSRGRAILAQRLTRRGIVVSAAIVPAALSQCAAISAAPTPELLASTTGVAVDFVTGTAPIPPTVTFLTSGVSKIMVFNSLKYVVIACGLLCVGAFTTRPIINHLHAMHATPRSASAATSRSPQAANEPVRPPARDGLEQLHRFLLGLLPWDVSTIHASADDKKDDTPKPLTGTWVKKEGELKIEFTEMEMRLYPHGDNIMIAIVCEYSRGKGDVVEAKVTGFEGKEEVKKAIAEKLPVGTKFTFKWKAKNKSATLEDIKGDKADLLKSHLEGELEEKK